MYACCNNVGTEFNLFEKGKIINNRLTIHGQYVDNAILCRTVLLEKYI